MVSTLRTIEDLKNEYDQANSGKEEKILEKINHTPVAM